MIKPVARTVRWPYCVGIVFLLFLIPHITVAEEVVSFDADIMIQNDATVHVVETIRYDFGNLERHGIFRKIPYRYATGAHTYTAAIRDIAVTDEHGTPYPVDTSKGGGFVTIKIGDSDTVISGTHTYRITYTVHDAVSYFEVFDELYWNITGNEWQVPMQHVSGTVQLPDNGTVTESSCYRGSLGSNTRCKTAQNSTPERQFTFADTSLHPGEGVTVAVAFPKGTVYEPTKTDRVLKIVRDNWIVVLPFLSAIFMWRLWSRRGRDPKGRSTIVAEFDAPKDMSPIESGGLVDENVQAKDITAQIVHLAVRGFLKIHQVERKKLLILNQTDYILEKKKSADDTLHAYDRKILDALFDTALMKEHEVADGSIKGVAVSDLKYKLATEMDTIKKEVYTALVEKGYFPTSPRRVRTRYVVYGLLVAGVLCGIVITNTIIPASFLSVISACVTGLIVAAFAFAMPVKTRAGAETRDHLLGLKRYLSVAEKARLEFHNSPKQTPERFDMLLPYAMIFDVEKEWAKQFNDIYKDGNAPGWYSMPHGHLFAPSVLASDLSQSFASAIASASAPEGGSGSGGGGFSGGGFGGGGGGSW